MKRWLLVLCACGLLATLAGADDKAAKEDKDKIQGTWSLVSGERDGKAVTDEEAKNLKIIFKGDKMTIKRPDRMREFTFKLDPTKKPKEIDVDMDGTPGTGIYELDGDKLKVAHGEGGAARPKDFTSKEGSGVTVMNFKRDKP